MMLVFRKTATESTLILVIESVATPTSSSRISTISAKEEELLV